MTQKPIRSGEAILRQFISPAATLAVFLVYVMPAWLLRKVLNRDRMHLRWNKAQESYWDRNNGAS